MPLYEYECSACGHRFEVIRKFSDPPEEKCPSCGGVVHKMQSAPAFQFKGTGWYVTDYAKSGQADSKGKAEGKAESADGKKEASTSGKTETSSAAAPASASSTSTTPAAKTSD